MKKRFLALIICVCTLIGAAVSAAGSSSQDSAVVSRSYLEGTYLQELIAMISSQITTAQQNTKTNALNKLDSIGQGYMDQLAPLGGSESKWLTASSFKDCSGEANDTITLAKGAGLIWTSGTATFTGTLIDLTEGAEKTGGALVTGHRYVAAAESVVTITSATGYWSVEGEWNTTSDGIKEPEISFEDVPADSPYYDAVAYVVKKGLFVGTSDTQFSPDVTINRGMMATVLHRFAGEPAVEYRPVFTDIAEGKWFTAGVIWAADHAVVVGMGDDTYRPNDSLTYQQVAIMFYNYANWLGLDTSVKADLTTVPGGESVASWASDQMAWAVGAGLMVTNAEGTLLAKEAASRAHVAVMMQRFDQLIAN